MKTLLILPIALTLLAAAPPRQLSLGPAVPETTIGPNPPPLALGIPAPNSRFEPAPLPNRDLAGPGAARATNDPSLAPTLFTTKTQFRGDGFSPGSTAQSDQERRTKPGAGFSLHMPLSPQ